MYVLPETIADWEIRYGTPREWSHLQDVTPEEFEIIRGSQKHGRAHDITFYVEHAGAIAVIAKPFYPPKLYRAPSGGLSPNESLEEGAGREAAEETGLVICLKEYLLRAQVRFTCESNAIDWVSHVFSATSEGSSLNPTDHNEIREARWANPSEFELFGRIMRRTPSSGLNYRAALHEQIARLHPLFQSTARQAR